MYSLTNLGRACTVRLMLFLGWILSCFWHFHRRPWALYAQLAWPEFSLAVALGKMRCSQIVCYTLCAGLCNKGQFEHFIELTAALIHLAVCPCRPTMILYGIDNIRDLFGHKVSIPVFFAIICLSTCHHHFELMVAG